MHKRLTATNLVAQGFTGRIEVSKRSYVGRRSVSDGVAIGFTLKRAGIFAMWQRLICDWWAMRRWSIGALSASSWRSVAKWLSSCANHWAMGLQALPTCLRMTASSCNKCSMRSDRLLKMVRKRSWKRDLLAIQDLNQYCLHFLLVNRRYTIMATIAAFCLSLCRRSNCSCPVVNILKTCKEMVRLWNASFLYAFVFIENRSTVSHRPVSAQLQPVTNHSPTGLNRSQAYRHTYG